MAKVENSILGKISGKVGKITFMSLNNQQIIRIIRNNTPKIDNLLSLKKLTPGTIKRINSSFILSLLSRIAKLTHHSLILPAWEHIYKKKRSILPSARLLFSQCNFINLFYSIPYPQNLINPANKPNLSKLLLTQGYLEETKIENLSYDPNTDKLKVDWNPSSYQNGNPDDSAYIMAIQLKITYPYHKAWENVKIWGNATHPVAKRRNGTATIQLSHLTYVSPLPLTVYLFFYSPKIGFSNSQSKDIDIPLNIY